MVTLYTKGTHIYLDGTVVTWWHWEIVTLWNDTYSHNYCCCSVAKSCPSLWDAMDCSTPGFPVLLCLPEFAQTHVHLVSDIIQPSHPVFPPSPPALSISQGLFQWVSSSHQVAKVLALQPQSLHEYSVLIFFKIDWLDIFAVQGTLKSLSSTTVWKHQFFSAQPSLWSNSHIHTWLLEKP